MNISVKNSRGLQLCINEMSNNCNLLQSSVDVTFSSSGSYCSVLSSVQTAHIINGTVMIKGLYTSYKHEDSLVFDASVRIGTSLGSQPQARSCLPIPTSPPPVGHYQITLSANRGTCVRTTCTELSRDSEMAGSRTCQSLFRRCDQYTTPLQHTATLTGPIMLIVLQQISQYKLPTNVYALLTTAKLVFDITACEGRGIDKSLFDFIGLSQIYGFIVHCYNFKFLCTHVAC